jgi:predicted acylesterase/phospholipase RssA
MEKMEKMEKWIPNVVVLGPGGSRGFLEIGALKRLMEEKIGDGDFLTNVKIWVGISVGAAISLLFVSGYTIDEIINICIGFNIVEDIMSINLDEISKNLGLIKMKTVEKKLIECVKTKFGFVPTLNQLYVLTGLELCLVSFNFDKMSPEFLDFHTEPELSCVEAALMSMSIPLLFQPRKYRGDIYIDGAIGAPYPVTKYDVNENKVLGMYICSEEDIINIDNKPLNYIHRLIHASMKVLRDVEIKHSSENVKNIVLKTSYKDTTGLTINEEARKNMIDCGYKIADTFLKINLNPEKYDMTLTQEIPFHFEL